MIERIKKRVIGLLFQVYKIIAIATPLKRWLFRLYSQQYNNRNKGFYSWILHWRIRDRFHELGYVVFKIHDLLLELNPVSLIDHKLISGKKHDPLISKLILDCLDKGGAFLDIGANIGYFSLLAAKLPAVKVFAFEPSPRELNRFYRNIALNETHNITVFPNGIADQEAVMTLYISEMSNPGKNSVINTVAHRKEEGECVKSSFAPLDYFITSYLLAEVRLCKIDVEGFEMSVLKGLANSIRFMDKAVFVVEILEGHLAKAGHQANEIYDFFKSYGYEPHYGFSKLCELANDTDYNEIFSKL